MLPLGHGLPDLLVQAIYHPSGRIDKKIRDPRDLLLRLLRENGFLPHFVATDGEGGMDGRHEDVFQSYADSETSNLAEIIGKLANEGEKDLLPDWAVSDLLHLMKNPRAPRLGKLAFNAQTDNVISGDSVSGNRVR
jgi:hypothetical protein